MKGQELSAVTVAGLTAAKKRLQNIFPPTPMLQSELLNLKIGKKVYLKAENLQPTGAYKIRGAYNKCCHLKEQFGKVSIITASSGNHGMACAYSAWLLGLKAKVVVPVPTPQIKKDNILALGAELIEFGQTYDESFEEACRLSEEGLFYVHPVSDVDVVSAQGTIGIEIMEQLPEARQVVIPLGGGGLSAGIAFALKQFKPHIQVMAVMPEGSDVYLKSRRAGKLVELENAASLADAVVRKTGEPYLFPYIENYVDEIVTVQEESIMDAVKLASICAKMTLEGAGALALAAILEKKSEGSDGTVLICSGGNIDLPLLQSCLTRG